MTTSSDAILLVAHGSSDLSADRTCSDLFYMELQSRFPGTPVYQAYSAPGTLRKIDRSSADTPVQTIDEACKQILSAGVKRLHVLALSLNPCKKYSRVRNLLEPYRSRFESLTMSSPLLNADDDPSVPADVLAWIIDHERSSSDEEYTQVLLAAHTATEEIAALWAPVLSLLEKECPLPVILIYRNGHPNAEDYLNSGNAGGRTLIIPLMMFGGRHLRKDLAEGDTSLRKILENAGITADLSGKGLGEYPQVREMFYKKIKV